MMIIIITTIIIILYNNNNNNYYCTYVASVIIISLVPTDQSPHGPVGRLEEGVNEGPGIGREVCAVVDLCVPACCHYL